MINIVIIATIISICNVCNAKQDFDEEKQFYQFKDTSHPFNPFVLTNETRKPNHGNTSLNPKINAHGKSVQILGFVMYILPVICFKLCVRFHLVSFIWVLTLIQSGVSWDQLPLRIPPDLRDHVEKHKLSGNKTTHLLRKRSAATEEDKKTNPVDIGVDKENKL